MGMGGLIKVILQNVMRYLSEELEEYCANNCTTTSQPQVVVANNSSQEIIIIQQQEEEEEEEIIDHHDSPQNNYIMSPPPLPLDLAQALEEIIDTINTIGILKPAAAAPAPASSGKIKEQRQRQGGSRGGKKRKNNNNVDVAINELKRIKHYNNQQKILLVGEGDFSFSACLALAFGRAPNIIATSLNSKEFLEKNYEKAASNIENIRMRDGKVMHGINATKIAKHASLGHIKFDRIIFNFPFAGFFTNLSHESVLRRHRRLVSLFMKNAKEMLSEDGEIHISHKTNGSHSEWNVESMASSHGLRLIQAVKFKQRDYPGYNTKYGFGGDQNFNCNPSKTYKFGLKIN
ncbi:hypothetical protein ACJIZ3_015380 [Penstemon smallii]|uniref:25S rRNA (uridine-N(3))-methyltransferase BMT5-like domain-containing protein n=1 Tax=Penstemon smallii TaxID=265156 RepID=A0ABD3RMC4_9LAMI